MLHCNVEVWYDYADELNEAADRNLQRHLEENPSAKRQKTHIDNSKDLGQRPLVSPQKRMLKFHFGDNQNTSSTNIEKGFNHDFSSSS